MLKYVLLGALTYMPLTGYQLKQFMERSTQHFWHAQPSQIYRTLDALEQEGFVTSQRQPQQDRPDRREYQLTDAGRADLVHWLAQPMTALEPSKETFLLRMFFSALLDKATVLTQLRLQRALRQQQLALFRGHINQTIRQSAAEHPDLRRDALMWDLTRRCGEATEQAMINWLDEAIQYVENEF
ncbi:PadR family transcriptional regulator [Candidatus Chloroploca sp. Khr17]|uniref:PadR family transcriptional regulator n=1 Tax=Candidatus Chloroploca sp. Khr17 TaxID=2496869 RepID=UPI00101C71AB|nr:PadR family transcriptional regulator [Candidatus Chloroploca sp. Khr17]